MTCAIWVRLLDAINLHPMFWDEVFESALANRRSLSSVFQIADVAAVWYQVSEILIDRFLRMLPTARLLPQMPEPIDEMSLTRQVITSRERLADTLRPRRRVVWNE